MRVVTWNMGCGGKMSRYRKHHADAWTYVVDVLQPDVLLVQEAVIVELRARYSEADISICSLPAGIDAGAAVAVRGISAARSDAWKLSPQSYVALMSAETPLGAITVASVHINPSQPHNAADLKSLAEALTASTSPLLVGGDLNAGRGFDEAYRIRRFASLHATLTTAGFIDPHWKTHEREAQTFWGHQAKNAYQLDHFFVSGGLGACVRSCRVVDDEVVRRVSDHAPIVLQLEMPSGTA